MQKLPSGVLAALAVIVLALGAAWWTSAGPAPASADPGPPPGNVLVPSIGRLVTVEQPSVPRRCGPSYQPRSIGRGWRRHC